MKPRITLNEPVVLGAKGKYDALLAVIQGGHFPMLSHQPPHATDRIPGEIHEIAMRHRQARIHGRHIWHPANENVGTSTVRFE